MTSLAGVILSGAKNLNSCGVLARKSQIDPLPPIRKTKRAASGDRSVLGKAYLMVSFGMSAGRSNKGGAKVLTAASVDKAVRAVET